MTFLFFPLRFYSVIYLCIIVWFWCIFKRFWVFYYFWWRSRSKHKWWLLEKIMLSSGFPWERVWFDPRKTLMSTIVPFRNCKERVVFLETLKANVCIENKWLLTLLFRTGSSLCLPEDLKRKGNFPNWVLFPNHLYSQVLKLPWQRSLWKYEIRHVHKLWKPIRLPYQLEQYLA